MISKCINSNIHRFQIEQTSRIRIKQHKVEAAMVDVDASILFQGIYSNQDKLVVVGSAGDNGLIRKSYGS